jgi:hypothetical protein
MDISLPSAALAFIRLYDDDDYDDGGDYDDYG